MGDTNRPVTRRVDGFVWLSRHARRTEIVSFVRGTKDSPPDWLKVDRVWPKVRRDRAIWKAAHPDGNTEHVKYHQRKPSLREVAESCKELKVSYQTVANVLAVYDSPHGPAPRQDQERLKLRKFARKAITSEVIKQFDAGEITASQVAELIGNGADYRNAVYWVAKMREVYQKQEEKVSTPKPHGGTRKAKRHR